MLFSSIVLYTACSFLLFFLALQFLKGKYAFQKSKGKCKLKTKTIISSLIIFFSRMFS